MCAVRTRDECDWWIRFSFCRRGDCIFTSSRLHFTKVTSTTTLQQPFCSLKSQASILSALLDSHSSNECPADGKGRAQSQATTAFFLTPQGITYYNSCSFDAAGELYYGIHHYFNSWRLSGLSQATGKLCVCHARSHISKFNNLNYTIHNTIEHRIHNTGG